MGPAQSRAQSQRRQSTRARPLHSPPAETPEKPQGLGPVDPALPPRREVRRGGGTSGGRDSGPRPSLARRSVPRVVPAAVQRRGAGRRAATRPRVRVHTLWLRLVLVVVAAAALTGGGFAGRRYHVALAESREAMVAWHAGRYATAATLLTTASHAWPWLGEAGTKAQAVALAAASAAYRQGIAAMARGAYAAAIGQFQRVVPADVDYAGAQRRLTALRRAGAGARRVEAVATVTAGMQANLAAFHSDYRVVMGDLVPAWEQYGFGDPLPYEQAASQPITGLAETAARMAKEAADLSGLAVCSVGLGTGSGADDLRAAVHWAQGAALAARGISSLSASSLASMEHGGALAVSEQVPTDIGGINAGAAALSADAATADQSLLRWERAARQAVDALLHRTVSLRALAATGTGSGLHTVGCGTAR